MATKENLQEAFAGESQANRTYLAFAAKADQDGLPQIAKLFRAAAEAETVHALAHLRVLGGIKSTSENLQHAIEGEGFEFQKMYPKFLLDAQQENLKSAEVSIRNALAVEEIHYNLYSKALEAVKSDRDLPASAIYVCSVCGNTVESAVPDVCPVCNAAGRKFNEVV